MSECVCERERDSERKRERQTQRARQTETKIEVTSVFLLLSITCESVFAGGAHSILSLGEQTE